MALPAPEDCGPIAATNVLSETIRRALIAACAGSYCPAVAVASSNFSSMNMQPGTVWAALACSKASTAPSALRAALSASAPVKDRLIPTLTGLSAATAVLDPSVMAADRVAAASRTVLREIMARHPCAIAQQTIRQAITVPT